jgi:hypothetical protein
MSNVPNRKACPLVNTLGLTMAVVVSFTGVCSVVAQRELFPHGEPKSYEQLMIELVNRGRADPLAESVRLGIGLNEGLDPDAISAAPKQPLGVHDALQKTAIEHAEFLDSVDAFTHIGEGGSTPRERMESGGYVFEFPAFDGENLNLTGVSGDLDPAIAAVSAYEGLFASAGHRINMLDPKFDEIGVGIGLGQFVQDGQAFNSAFVVQNFATSAATPGPLVVGVVYSDTDGNGFYSAGEGLGGVRIETEPGSFFTISSTSGGYAIPIPQGASEIVVSATGLSGGTVSKSVAVGDQNGKVDFSVATDVVVLPPPPRLSMSTVSGEDAVTLTVKGTLGKTYMVERSRDLDTWEDFQTISLVSANRSLKVSFVDDIRLFFYRVREI